MPCFRTLVRVSGSLAAALSLSGCVVYGEPIGSHHDSYYPVHRGHSTPIPPGHLPPPGECRIWFPDRPPGHQPPPGDCRDLERRVPPGAVLVRG